MATFEFLRLSLSVPSVTPLGFGSEKPKEPRAEYIKYLFSSRIDFFYRTRLFTYVPAASRAIPSGYIAGYVGKQTSELENAGPESLFALQPHKRWKAAFLIVSSNPDEQFVAFEKRMDVGSAHTIVEAIVEARLKENKVSSWNVDVEYITEKSGFWDAAKKYKGEITELNFTFNPPNGLKGFEKFKEFDRLAQQQTNAENSEYALKNKNGGVVAEGEFVESAVEYASEGAGKTTLKVGRKTVYDSRRSKKTTTLPESLMPRESEETKIAGAAEHVRRAISKDSKT